MEPRGLHGGGVPLAAVVRAKEPLSLPLTHRRRGEGRGYREGSAAPPACLEPVNCVVMECVSVHSNRFRPSSWL